MSECQQHELLMNKVDVLKETVDKIDKRLSRQEDIGQSTVTTVQVRKAEMDAISGTLYRIESSLKENFTKLEERVDQQDEKIQALEEKPGNFWSSVLVGFLSAAAAGIVVYLSTKGG